MTRRCGSHDKRTTGTTWQNIRKKVLSDNPLCVHCQLEGKVTLAQEVDHKKPLHQGGTDDLQNLQGLCKEHHSIKSALEQGYKLKKKVSIGIDGWII
jgi:5-methylcytosine-specific restriction protein A